MKIFFNASLTGKKEYEDNYRKIIEVINQLGHEQIESSLFKREPEDVAKETSEEAVEWHKKLRQWIAKCDLAVFEVSHPSTGIGHEISLVLNLGKPVVALYVSGREPFVLESIADERLQVVEYELRNIKEAVADAIEYAAEQIDTRFNFFIAPKHQHYLDWISRKKMVPRAVHLRRLLERDMAANKDYQDELAGSSKQDSAKHSKSSPKQK